MPEKSHILEQRLYKLQAWITAGLAFIVVAISSISGVIIWQTTEINRNAAALEKTAIETHNSLCSFKLDLQKRYDSSVEFLKKHPNGIPGIPRDVLLQSQKNQKATLDSLENLQCEEQNE